MFACAAGGVKGVGYLFTRGVNSGIAASSTSRGGRSVRGSGDGGVEAAVASEDAKGREHASRRDRLCGDEGGDEARVRRAGIRRVQYWSPRWQPAERAPPRGTVPCWTAARCISQQQTGRRSGTGHRARRQGSRTCWAGWSLNLVAGGAVGGGTKPDTKKFF
jgi:hypothetical protein